jgi:hypothetical protein
MDTSHGPVPGPRLRVSKDPDHALWYLKVEAAETLPARKAVFSTFAAATRAAGLIAFDARWIARFTWVNDSAPERGAQ